MSDAAAESGSYGTRKPDFALQGEAEACNTRRAPASTPERLRRAWSDHRWAAQHLAGFDLTPSQHALLRAAQGDEVFRLAARAGLAQATVSRGLGPLIRRGLLARVSGRSRGKTYRCWLIEPTVRGRELLARVDAA